MALPASISNSNLDSQNDSPILARAQQSAAITTINSLIAALGDLSTADAGDGLRIVNGSLEVHIPSTASVSIVAGNIRDLP